MTLISPETDIVCTLKLKVVEPAGIVTVEGTFTNAVFELIRLTTASSGTGELKVRLPVDGVPGATCVGLTINEIRRTRFNCAVMLTPLKAAVIVTGPACAGIV